MDLIVGLIFLLIGAVIYSVVRWLRGGPLLDPGPHSLKEFVEQKRTIIHPAD